MRKEVLAPLIVLLMLGSMGGYVIMNNDGTEPNDTDNGDGTGEGTNLIGDEWDVYYVDTGNDLPSCDSSTLGRLYYVADTAGFETCTSSGWAFIDLTGPPGNDGNNGADFETSNNDGNDGNDEHDVSGCSSDNNDHHFHDDDVDTEVDADQRQEQGQRW